MIDSRRNRTSSKRKARSTTAPIIRSDFACSNDAEYGGNLRRFSELRHFEARCIINQGNGNHLIIVPENGKVPEGSRRRLSEAVVRQLMQKTQGIFPTTGGVV